MVYPYLGWCKMNPRHGSSIGWFIIVSENQPFVNYQPLSTIINPSQTSSQTLIHQFSLSIAISLFTISNHYSWLYHAFPILLATRCAMLHLPPQSVHILRQRERALGMLDQGHKLLLLSNAVLLTWQNSWIHTNAPWKHMKTYENHEAWEVKAL